LQTRIELNRDLACDGLRHLPLKNEHVGGIRGN
jgi:hypothetical protein